MRIPRPFVNVVNRALPMLLLFHVIFHLQVFGNQNGNQKITIIGNDLALGNVLKSIEKQSGLRFMYASGDLNIEQHVNVSFRNAFLDDVLINLFTPQKIVWKYVNGSILLKVQKQFVKGTEPSFSADRGDLSGKIQSVNGDPIPGATILIKDTNKGTKSNSDGAFLLTGIEPGTILVITSIGFETKELALKDLKDVLIILKPTIGELDEVVIAYGKAAKRSINGNISIIKAEDIAKSPVQNPLLALSGRVPGISIRQSTGFSGGGITTLIQGQNSIGKGNDPFYVIDGVPYTSQLLPLTNANLGSSGVTMPATGNPMNYINPSDIESISVLKDADATAIYGSRAANGAILITTKKGHIGKTKVVLDYQQGWSKVTRFMDVLNTKQYLEMRREAIKNDGGEIAATDYDINGFWDTTKNSNYQKEWIGNTASYSNINASISGGSNYIQYLVGGTFHKETTVMPGNWNDQKAAFHFSLNSSSENRKFQMQFTGNYMVDNNRLPFTDLTAAALNTPPNAPSIYNKDGSYNFMPNTNGRSTFVNPFVKLENRNHNRTTNLVSNLTLSYNLLPGLKIKSSFGYTDLRSTETTTLPIKGYSPEQLEFAQRTSINGNNDINSWIIEPQITYEKMIGKNKIDVLVGSSIQNNIGNGRQIQSVGYADDTDIGNLSLATDIFPVSLSEYVYKYLGLFGRLNYMFSNRYSVSVSARRDGSSRFGSANRYHNFGAIGLGWTFSDEDFFRNNLSFINYGKLRASYGTTGNDQIGNYQYLSLYEPVSVNIPYGGLQGLGPAGIPNPYLQWESTRKINVGVDINTWNDRMVLTANYFRNTSSNQLVGVQLPSIAGGLVLTQNFPATVQNTGWEFTWETKIIKKVDFQWSVNLNLTIPRNKLVNYENLENSTDKNRLIIGRSLNVLRLFHSLGVNPETGVYQFADSKGNPTDNPDYETDRIVTKDLSNLYYGGLNTSLTYKGFSFDILFSLVKQNAQGYFTGISVPGRYRINQPTYVLDRWRGPVQLGAHQRFNANNQLSYAINNANASDLAVTDASFIRLKNFSISWTAPDRLVKKINLSSIRIYGQGQNLLTFTKYKGLDPESLSLNSLPPMRTFVLGMQLGF